MPIRKQRLGRWWERLQETSDPKPRQLIVGSAVAIASVFGFAAVSMATAPLKQNDVDEIMEANEGAASEIGQLGATSTQPIVVTTAPAATVAGATPTAAPTSAAPTTASIGGGRFIAIGDSVMKGAATPLQAMGFDVFATESVQFHDVVPQVESLMQSGSPPELVVIGLGTNGTIDDDDAAELFDALAPIPHVIVLTLHVERSWAPSNNELIQGLQGRYPNVTVLNWDSLAAGCADWATAQGMSGNCYASDGFHLSSDGADYYVELIRYTAEEQLGVALT